MYPNPAFFAHISVELLSAKVPLTRKYELLSKLAVDEKAKTTAISPNCRGQQRRRLMDLSIVHGSLISPEIRSASGDPVATG
ncbi:hypothetical protein [uncultured Sunxiuqinia sp.]|uniref:hypothetical protein n=1 Tax=uncultured Sunxiuqinia sp. TaxID=1573825 RepID=UPI002AA71E2E|nr:hypothetical protein [uncultured Sunxiuqinia sp.]